MWKHAHSQIYCVFKKIKVNNLAQPSNNCNEPNCDDGG